MARTTVTEKERTRERLVHAAGRGFRKNGFGGIGVDAVAKEAGVTSGAFYAHFASKADIFRTALAEGLDAMRVGLGTYRKEHGERWLRRFAPWYLNAERRADIANSCALATLTLEAARSDEATRALYDAHVKAIAKELQAGLAGKREADAWAILALLSGGLSIAHAINDPKLRARVASAVVKAIVAIDDASA